MRKSYLLLILSFLSLTFIVNGKGKGKESFINSKKDHQVSIPITSKVNEEPKKEIIQKRNQFSKHYINDDGTFKMRSSASSLHYMNRNRWIDIDLDIKKNTSGEGKEYPYYNKENSFKTFYPQSPTSGPIMTRLKEGDIKEVVQSLYVTNEAGETIYTFPISANTKVKVDHHQLMYQDVFPAIDIRYSQQSDGRKFDVVLKNKQSLHALPIGAKYVIIQEKIYLPSDWVVSETLNGIDIHAGNTWIANIPTPNVYETFSSKKQYHTDEDFTNEGSMQVIKNGNEITLLTKFSVEWLQHSQRNFPVYLDPVTNYYPSNVSMATGNMSSATAAKVSGTVRLGIAGGISWAYFDLSTIPFSANIISANYGGYHYTGFNTDKIGSIIGMQNVNPITATNTTINTQIATVGPVYNSSYIFGGSSAQWRIGSIGANGLSDINTQISQGWTALGFRYTSGYTGTMLQYGYNAANSNDRPYLELNYSTIPCSGIPVAGTAISSLASVCVLPFTLNLIGNTTDNGINYQWQSSVPGANNWSNIGSATVVSQLNITQSVASDYRCIVTCTNSSGSDTSTIVSVAQNSFTQCYCIPSGSNSSFYINNFSTTGGTINITNNATGFSTGGFGNYTSMTASATQGTSLGVSIGFLTGNHTVGVWIDWNQDGDFIDAGENVLTTGTLLVSSPKTGSFTVPLTAMTGITRMRVRTSSSGAATPCGASAFGEAEDYTLNVLPSCTSSISALISNSSYTVCAGTTLTLNATIGTPMFYQWKQSNISGGPYTNVIGGIGATTLQYTTPVLTTGSKYYVLETICTACSPCSSVSNEVSIVVKPTSSGSSSAIACNSYTWMNTTYTTSGVYLKTFINSVGCDSIQTLNLTIHNSNNISIPISACNSYIWDGNTYTTSGIYSFSYTNMFGCDSVRTLNLTINYSNSGSSNLTTCNSYLFGGTTYTVSGVYTKSFINSGGCDSIHTLNLTIKLPSIPSSFNITICNSYVWVGITYTMSGIYSRTFINSVGCDSVRTLNLTIGGNTVTQNYRAYVPNYGSGNVSVVELSTNSVIATIPVGTQPLGSAINPAGTRVYITNYGSNTVSVINTYTNAVIATIAGMSGPYRVLMHPSGNKIYVTNANGNNVKVVNTITNLVEATIAVGTSPNGICLSPDLTKLYVCNYATSNITIINTGTNTVTSTIASVPSPLNIAISNDGLKLFVGSFSASEIKVVSTVTNTVIATIPSTGALPTGMEITKDGTKLYLVNQGSSSTMGIINTTTNAVISTLTPGLSYPFGISFNKNESLLYVASRGTNMLDAVNTITNTVVSSIPVGTDPRSIGKFIGNTPFVSVTACSSYTWSGNTYTVSGIYSMTFTSSAGCDSIGTLNLTINLPNSGSSNLSVCNSYSWNGNTYTNSGVYTGTFINYKGCDSVHTLNLNISNQNSSGSSIINVCNSYVFGGTTYTISGIYTKTFTNAVACDSIHTLNLTIRYSNTGSSNLTTCNSYIWNGLSYMVSGNYLHTYTNVAGCDSVHILHLIIYYSNNISTTVSVCNSYLWNGTIFTVSGIYSLTFTNAGGCDSVRVLNLTIKHSSSGSSIINICNTYLFNGTTYTTSGIYTGTFINSAGCDSVHTLNLIVRHRSFGTSRAIACNSYLWNGVTYTLSGAYLHTYANAAGCDSIHTLNLTLHPYNSNVIPKAYIPTLPNGIAVLDITTNAITNNIVVGNSPRAVAFSPDGSKVYVSNFSSNNVSVINTVTNTVTTTINTYYGPSIIVMHPNKNKMYVLSQLYNTVNVINTLTNTLDTTFVVGSATGNGLSGMAISPDGNKLYVSDYWTNSLSVINTNTNTITSTIPSLFTSLGPLRLALSPDGTKLYFTGLNAIVVMNTTTYAITATLSVPNYHFELAFTPDGSKIYILDQQPVVHVINATTNTFLTDVLLNTNMIPTGISVSPDGSKVFVLYDTPSYISIINTQTNTLTDSITLSYAAEAYGSFTGNIGLNKQTVCNSYSWNGNTYTSTGTYTQTAVNMFGCDSISTLNLIIKYSNGGVSNATACDVYVWNGTTYTTSGTYTKTFTNVAGCDSLQTLNLTIKHSSSVSYSYTGCNYTWNGITYTVSGVYTQSFINAVGCDSLNYLNLTLFQNAAPKFQKAFIPRQNKNDVLVMNLDNNTKEDSIPVGNFPICVSASPNGSKVYVTNSNSNTISVISTINKTVINTITLTTQPEGVVVSPTGNRVYVANLGSNKVIVIDGISDTIMTSVTVGSQPYGICVSPDGSKVYVTNKASNTVSVINAVTNLVIATINVGTEPRGIVVSPDGSKLYVANRLGQTVSVINTSTNSVISTIIIPTGTYPEGIAITPNGLKVYVTSTLITSGVVTAINTATNTVQASISLPGGWYPSGISINKDGSKVYAVSMTAGFLYIISTATNTFTNSVNLGGYAYSLGNFIADVGGTVADAACATYTWNGTTYTATGVYTYTAVNAAGCDSITNLSLTVHPNNSTTTSFNQIACDSYLFDGVTYTASGVYTHTFANTHLCDSVRTLNLTIHHSNTGSSSVTTCNNSYSWNANTYSVSGNYIGTFTNTSGCDSVYTLNLTIGHSNTTLQKAYVANYGSNNVSVINLATNSVSTTIPVGTGPQGVSVNPDGSRVYITNTLSGSVSVINTSTDSVVATINVPSPRGIIVSPDRNRVYVTSITANSVSVIDAGTNTIITTIPVGNYPAEVCINSIGTILYVSNYGSNTVSVINTITNTLITNINVGSQPDGICITPNNNFVYVVNNIAGSLSGSVSIINTITNTVVSTIAMGIDPVGIAISPDGSLIYITGTFGTLLKVLNTATNSVVASISVGSNQAGVSVSPDGNFVFVTLYNSNLVKVVNTHSNTVVATIPVGTTPYSIGNFIASIGGTKFQTACNSYIWNGSTYTASGIYSYTTVNVSGCDSFSKLNLTIIPNNNNTYSSSISTCNSYTWNGNTYTSSGAYTSTFINAAGCDSIFTINLTINHSTNSTTNISTSNSYTWNENGMTYTNSGTYIYTYLNSTGCLHTSTLNLTISTTSLNSIAVSQDQSVSCYGLNDGSCQTTVTPIGNYTYQLNGGAQTNNTGFFSGLAPGIHTVCVSDGQNTLCDTVLIHEPNPLLIQFVIDSLVSCHGNDGKLSVNITGGTNVLQGYLTWWMNANGDTLNNLLSNNFASSLSNLPSGNYSVTVEDDHGCFATNSITLNNELPLIVSSNHTAIICHAGTSVITPSATGGSGSIVFTINNAPLLSSYTAGTYTITATDARGCTNEEVITITEPASLDSMSSVTVCDSYTWTSNGSTYTNSGVYTFSSINSAGCVGITTLNLIINNSSVSQNTINSIASYTWSANNITYTNSGIYIASFINTNGCDSIHILNLTITGVAIASKVFLTGPYNQYTGLMHDSLRVLNLIPLTEPYSLPPFNKPQIGDLGGETTTSTILSVSGNNAIVDWIFIELRAAANQNSIVATKRALLQRDGDIVSHLDGISPLVFENIPQGNYFIGIKHRNHLGVMTAFSYPLNYTSASIDFTSSMPAYTISSIPYNAPQKVINGVYTLWGGDANYNKNIKYNGGNNDKDKVLVAVGMGTSNNIITAYRTEDVNMDGKVKYNNADNDKNFILTQVGINTPNIILSQHAID